MRTKRDTFWPEKPYYQLWTTMLGSYPTATKSCRFPDEQQARTYVDENVPRIRKGFLLSVIAQPSGRRVYEREGIA